MSWQRIRGHDSIVASFAELIRKNRLGHAYLLAGPQGVGKKLFAFQLAKALLCEKPKNPFDSCDQCSSCSLVDARTHPDLVFAARPDDKVEFPIDVVRDVSEKLALKPARGGYKIAILDDVDDFNDASANAFLKTLEEPPPKSLLLLLVVDPEGQLQTIQSRCQIVRFAPLSAELIGMLLREKGLDVAQAERLARIGGGSLGQAVELAEPEIWKFRKDLVTALGRERIDTVGLAKKWFAFVEEAGKESGMQRRRAALTLTLLIDLLEQAVRASTGAPPADLSPEDGATVRRLAERLGTDGLLRWIDRCLEANYQLDRKVQLVLVIEAMADALNVA